MTALLLGLDIGGTKSAAIVGDDTGTVLARRQIVTPQEPWQGAMPAILALLHEVCEDYGCAPSAMAALGVSGGGPVDSRTGTIYSPPNLPGWDAVPLKALLEEEFQVTVTVENDANATAVAEHRWGAGIGCSEMAFLTMGTGIGAGLILEGQLYRGRRDLAGEIGHATLLPDGPLCPCGKRGCLEALASGTAMTRIGRELYGDSALTAETICARARSGDSVAQNIIFGVAEWMGRGLANLLHTLNLERIVLGTLAVYAGDLLMEPIRQAAQANCWPRVWDGVTIVPAALGEAAQDKAALAVALMGQEAVRLPSRYLY